MLKLSAALCRAGRCIVLFLVFTRGQSVLTQRVDKATAGFLQKPEVSPFEAGMLSRVGLDTSQTDAVAKRPGDGVSNFQKARVVCLREHARLQVGVCVFAQGNDAILPWGDWVKTQGSGPRTNQQHH